MSLHFFLICFCIIFNLSAENNLFFDDIEGRFFHKLLKESPSVPHNYNPHVPIDLWNELEPYFLPPQHPIKTKLDRLFLKTRVTQNEQTFTDAGFSITRKNRPFNALVSGHSALKGYLVKVYLDRQCKLNDWKMWLRRIQGAEIIKACIKKHGFTAFVVPSKWIYPLPAEPSPPLSDEYYRKNFILIVEDMNILNDAENRKAYKQKMTPRLLKELYIVLNECELTDCVYIGNMPFTKSGKIAFVDTELYHNGPVDFQRFKKYLSTAMRSQLDKIIQK